MRNSIARVACLPTVMLALWGTAAAAAAWPPPGPLGVDVSIERRQDGSYLCVAKVSQLETGELLAAPQIAFRSGDTASVKVGSKDADGRAAELKFEVSADETEGTALFRMTAVQGGVETQLQQLRVRLR